MITSSQLGLPLYRVLEGMKVAKQEGNTFTYPDGNQVYILAVDEYDYIICEVKHGTV